MEYLSWLSSPVGSFYMCVNSLQCSHDLVNIVHYACGFCVSVYKCICTCVTNSEPQGMNKTKKEVTFLYPTTVQCSTLETFFQGTVLKNSHDKLTNQITSGRVLIS